MELKLEKISDDTYMNKRLSAIKNKTILIYGAGSFGKETCLFFNEYGINIAGFLDKRAAQIENYCGLPVYGLQEELKEIDKREVLVLFSIVMDKDEREQVKRQIYDAGFENIEDAQLYRSLKIIPDDLNGRSFLQYYTDNKERIKTAEGLWADDKSRRIFHANIKAHFTKDFSECREWEDPMKEQYFPEDIKMEKGYDRFVDCGGYIGDTVETLLRIKKPKAVASFEPDCVNFEKLAQNCNGKEAEIICFPCAVSDKTGYQSFSSARGSGTICEQGEIRILSVSLDQALKNFQPAFIKMDIEGEELKAIEGAKHIINKEVPDLAICVYHNTNHIWDIMLLLDSWCLGYRFYLRSYNAYTMETVLYATRREN